MENFSPILPQFGFPSLISFLRTFHISSVNTMGVWRLLTTLAVHSFFSQDGSTERGLIRPVPAPGRACAEEQAMCETHEGLPADLHRSQRGVKKHTHTHVNKTTGTPFIFRSKDITYIL